MKRLLAWWGRHWPNEDEKHHVEAIRSMTPEQHQRLPLRRWEVRLLWKYPD